MAGEDMAGDQWDPTTWIDELASDRTYVEQVVPLAVDLMRPVAGQILLDLGCGEGQVMRALSPAGALVVGCDLSLPLLRHAVPAGPVVMCRLPDLGWLLENSVDTAFAVLVLEHLEDLQALFAEAARVVKPGGGLVVVRNHPLITAPGSSPVIDPADQELLWRWGQYLTAGATTERVGQTNVVFRHTSLADLLNPAAAAGWLLQRVVEQAIRVPDDPVLATQREIPRLLGIRFELPP